VARTPACSNHQCDAVICEEVDGPAMAEHSAQAGTGQQGESIVLVAPATSLGKPDNQSMGTQQRGPRRQQASLPLQPPVAPTLAMPSVCHVTRLEGSRSTMRGRRQ
jgi:hypothetical protein